MEKTKVIYISGCITIDPDHWKEHFMAAENKLLEMFPDAFIYNPLRTDNEVDWSKATTEEERYDLVMRHDVNILMKCNAIYMLKDWEKSKGAKLENSLANFFKMEVLYEEGAVHKS